MMMPPMSCRANRKNRQPANWKSHNFALVEILAWESMKETYGVHHPDRLFHSAAAAEE
jgi:hypothetical protein